MSASWSLSVFCPLGFLYSGINNQLERWSRRTLRYYYWRGMGSEFHAAGLVLGSHRVWSILRGGVVSGSRFRALISHKHALTGLSVPEKKQSVLYLSVVSVPKAAPCKTFEDIPSPAGSPSIHASGNWRNQALLSPVNI